MKRNEIAAAIHKRMCEDDRFGYSWEERYGATREVWTIGGEKIAIKVDGATFTGNMREVFVSSGLFEWKPMSFVAQPGDLYLNEENHVAMCQTQTPDVLSEFSWGDNGAYGNRRGDQSGNEASVHGYYDYPWDGILHYNGKADGAAVGKPAANTAPAQPRYQVKGISRWGEWKSCGETRARPGTGRRCTGPGSRRHAVGSCGSTTS